MAVEVDAPAKVNLTLHVTGRRPDGYHLIDSLVVFTDIADRLRVHSSAVASLRVEGPEASCVPEGAENSVLRACALFGATAAIVLEKRLPSAAGIGGGSSDAAACLRALAAIEGREVPDALSLGADVPVCLHGRPARMSGIGERLEDVAMPPLWMTLVNPRRSVPTGAIFAGLAARENAAMPARLPRWRGAGDLAAWLRLQRNDLQATAIRIEPRVADVLAVLEATSDCLLARMSGSGATCFGLYQNAAAARAAALDVGAARPGWWVAATAMRHEAPLPRPVQETRATT